MTKRIVTTTSVFQPGYPAEDAMDRLKRIGFEGQDMALDYWRDISDSPFMAGDCEAWGRALRARAEKIGIPYTHAHAPGEAEDNPLIERSIRTASALGARYMVLHPAWHLPDDTIIEDERAFVDRNVRLIAPWLTLAREMNVTILSENLLWGSSRDPRVIARLVEAVGSPYVGWCYDTGHANCFGFRPQVLKECAAAPLSLHIQDNHGGPRDEHLIPGDGTVDFKALTDTLKAIGYAGDCVLEAHHQSLEAPDDRRDEILARLLEKARRIRADMESI